MNEFDAVGFEQAAFLAREVGERLASRLDIMTLQPKVIVDLSFDAGLSAGLLKQRYPEAHLLVMGEKFSLLKHTQENSVYTKVTLLPLADQSVDLIFSNFLLPWCVDLQKVFQEWRRILRPEGLLIFTSLGPDTLRELSECTLIPKLVDMHDVGDKLGQVGLIDPVLDVEYITVTYQDSEKQLRELQLTGMIANDQLEKMGVKTISYEIVFGQAWGSRLPVGFAADEAGVARIPLSHLRKRR